MACAGLPALAAASAASPQRVRHWPTTRQRGRYRHRRPSLVALRESAPGPPRTRRANAHVTQAAAKHPLRTQDLEPTQTRLGSPAADRATCGSCSTDALPSLAACSDDHGEPEWLM